MTVPLPVYNRNQGNILHAESIVMQTRVLLADAERKVRKEVSDALDTYRTTREYLADVRTTIIPQTEARVSGFYQRLVGPDGRARGGVVDVDAYNTAIQEQNAVALDYIDALVRLRRSMLAINTAVGIRLIP